MASQVKPVTKTQELFHKINNYTCCVGLLNLWGGGVRLPAIYTNIYYKLFYKLMNLLICVLIALQFGAFYKRDTFNAKQKSDWVVFTLSHPIISTFYLSLLYYKNNLQELLLCLAVKLKEGYNDSTVELRMITRVKVYIASYLLLCGLTMIMFGFDSLIQVIQLGKTFTSIITVWPDVEDESILAAAGRILIYIVWWILVSRSTTAYILTIASTICLSHQFQNLQSYFYGLDDIFHDEELSQIEREEKYEKAFKVGIKMHSETLWCARQCQLVYGIVYSGQIFINLMGLVVLMLQMVNSERTIVNALAIVATASSILVTNGIFMWNAGDVTVEAANLATAMYSSGWQNCEKTSAVRVRKLLVVAMTQVQKPVIIKGFGILELSYESYLSIVKSSYSVFSVIY